jgi:hypothetical protein
MPRGLIGCIVADLDMAGNKKDTLLKRIDIDIDAPQKSQNGSSPGSVTDPESGHKMHSAQLETAPSEKASPDMAIRSSSGTPDAIINPTGEMMIESVSPIN